jgi:hypothetical protein
MSLIHIFARPLCVKNATSVEHIAGMFDSACTSARMLCKSAPKASSCITILLDSTTQVFRHNITGALDAS